jgi:hypothetical protein
MAGIAILRRLLLKDAVKRSAPHSGIMSIGPDVRKMVDRQVNKWIESAKRQGQDIDKMGEQEIKYIVEMNKPKAPKVYSNEEAYEILNRFANRNQRGEVIQGKFGKPFAEEIVTVERVVTDIKKMKPIDSMKEANKVLRGEGRYKSLSKADREKIVNDESVTDHIFERNIEPDPEDFAQGGRTGLSYLLAEDTNERMPMWMGGGFSAGKGLLRKLLEHYSKKSKIGAKPTDLLKIINPKQFNEILNRPEGIPALAKDMIKDYTTKVKKDRAGTIEELISSAKNIKKADDAIIAHKKWMIEDMVKKGIDRENAEMFAEGLSKAMAKAGPKDAPKITEQGLLELENIYKNLITKDRLLNAEGGRIGYAGGGMGRRAFLKLMGGVGAGIGALKTGALKLFGKEGATVAKEVTSVPIKNIEGMPSWFKPLVNKVIREGEEVSGDLERIITHKTKLPESKTDVYVTQDLNTGDVVVDIGMGKHGWADGHYGQPVRLEYKAAEDIMSGPSDEPFKVGVRDPLLREKVSIHEDLVKDIKPGKEGLHLKPGKTKEEFWVEEAEFTGGHPENVKFDESTIEKYGEHGSDFSEVERFATGKNVIKDKSGKFKEVKTLPPTKKAEGLEWARGRAEAQAEEAAEMADDFASGGIARMLGE